MNSAAHSLLFLLWPNLLIRLSMINQREKNLVLRLGKCSWTSCPSLESIAENFCINTLITTCKHQTSPESLYILMVATKPVKPQRIETQSLGSSRFKFTKVEDIISIFSSNEPQLLLDGESEVNTYNTMLNQMHRFA